MKKQTRRKPRIVLPATMRTHVETNPYYKQFDVEFLDDRHSRPLLDPSPAFALLMCVVFLAIIALGVYILR